MEINLKLIAANVNESRLLSSQVVKNSENENNVY